MLVEAAAHTFEPKLVPWLLQQGQNARGNADERAALRTSILVTAMKLALPEELPAVKKAVGRWGTALEKALLAQVESVVVRCARDTSCYLEVLTHRETQDHNRQFAGIKAAYLIGMLGDTSTRDALVARLDRVTNAALRFVSAMAIDHLSPGGSLEVADDLRAIVEANSQSPDRERAAGDAPLAEVMLRLEARAR